MIYITARKICFGDRSSGILDLRRQQLAVVHMDTYIRTQCWPITASCTGSSFQWRRIAVACHGPGNWCQSDASQLAPFWGLERHLPQTKEQWTELFVRVRMLISEDVDCYIGLHPSPCLASLCQHHYPIQRHYAPPVITIVIIMRGKTTTTRLSHADMKQQSVLSKNLYSRNGSIRFTPPLAKESIFLPPASLAWIDFFAVLTCNSLFLFLPSYFTSRFLFFFLCA